MNDSFGQLFESIPSQDAAGPAVLMFHFLLYVVIGLLPICGVLYLTYFLLTLPMRRNERARLFLDLLELGLKQGRTPEAAIGSAAASRDQSLGARFHLVAAHLETGMRLSQALDQVPRPLPPQIRAMLTTGQRIGDIAKVLPACRQLLNDGVSQVRGALNYLIMLVFTVTPFAIAVPIIIQVKVMPSFKMVFNDMLAGESLPAFTRLVFAESGMAISILTGLLGLVWLLMLAYVGGPRLHGWLREVLPGVTDGILCRLPWRRKRLQRDFSAMLAVLLDAQVPEAEAVSLAGDCLGNVVLGRRASQVRQLLNDGSKLAEAIRALDDSEEFRWRLTNALRRRGGFLRALTGWQESLDAKAFQLEQSAAQIATTVLVLFNGLIVASIVIAVFLALTQFINRAALW